MFHCIYCGVYSKQKWGKLFFQNGSVTEFRINQCEHCGEIGYWYKGKLIIPVEAFYPPPHIDLPNECITDYNEARDIVARSPRAAAALLRLCLKNLMGFLGDSRNNVSDDMVSLVKNSLPVEVRKGLDFCGLDGNNGAYPGGIVSNDGPEIAKNLFEVINLIVEYRISRKK